MGIYNKYSSVHVVILLVKLFVPDDKPPKTVKKKKFDIVGYISIVIAMACMQIVLDRGQQYNWFDTPWICYLTGICIFSFIFSMCGNWSMIIR